MTDEIAKLKEVIQHQSGSTVPTSKETVTVVTVYPIVKISFITAA